MKLFIKISLLLMLPVFSFTQQIAYWEEWNKEQADSLRLIWNNTSNDTLRMGVSRSLGFYYMELNMDSGLYYSEHQLAMARQLKLKLWEADALDGVAYILSNLKDYPGSLKAFLAAIKIAEDKETEKNIWQLSRFSETVNPVSARLAVLSILYMDLARLYGYTGNIEKQLFNSFESLKNAETAGDPSILSNVYSNLGFTYANQDKLDSALSFLEKSLHYYDVSGFKKYKGGTLSYVGIVYFKKGNYALAKKYFYKAVEECRQVNNIADLSFAYLYLSDVFSRTGDKDSSLFYAYNGLENAQLAGSPDYMVRAFTSLSANYKLRNNTDSAFFYQGLALAIKDSINSVEKIKQFQNIGFDELLRVQELEKEKMENQNRVRIYAMLAGLGVFLAIGLILYRNNLQKQKANKVLEHTVSNLKSTQSQLIQSEKMASLGELTAGIAHEIQNPLNFVNNFSELSNELITEMNEEIDKGNTDEAKAIASDIKQNLEKINHHGKRADSIVKGMLQHSQKGSGQKEPTDLNAMAEEYLRLAYHGTLAKDITLNASFVTDLDKSIGNVNLVQQDISRVLLNLFSNAFYAVSERQKQEAGDYQPMVTLITKRKGELIEIRVKDNGSGIPENIKEKIFQPFFTTKPTGQGTGLGLSLSYDTIKAHGGELKVETKEGEGASFIIQLPVNYSA